MAYKISVITPTYNSSATVAETINSVINQNCKDFEHIIIDNMSSDNTLEIIKAIYNNKSLSNNLRILCERDNSITEAYNKGIILSQGEFITFLNSDDHFLYENIFDTVLNIFESKEVLFTHSVLLLYDSLWGEIIIHPHRAKMSSGMIYNHPGMFLRKELFLKFGNYDTRFKIAMDFELLCRLEKNISNFHKRGVLISSSPTIYMGGNGLSSKYFSKALKEAKSILQLYKMWNIISKNWYYRRKFKNMIKKFIMVILNK